ncbi:hypothetical protein I4F81_004206 [Pyropia yezoensis]|uniref:Uncharacterized protein n=1 Tax=Pyropia yezoensis TaxID=2788 RepID=A0ACC3BV84_PYRYE|nr:hypothetical protein I4F81_004206 [Neopyropia yezoensis]
MPTAPPQTPIVPAPTPPALPATRCDARFTPSRPLSPPSVALFPSGHPARQCGGRPSVPPLTTLLLGKDGWGDGEESGEGRRNGPSGMLQGSGGNDPVCRCCRPTNCHPIPPHGRWAEAALLWPAGRRTARGGRAATATQWPLSGRWRGCRGALHPATAAVVVGHRAATAGAATQ